MRNPFTRRYQQIPPMTAKAAWNTYTGQVSVAGVVLGEARGGSTWTTKFFEADVVLRANGWEPVPGQQWFPEEVYPTPVYGVQVRAFAG